MKKYLRKRNRHKRLEGRNRHHLIPRSRGGNNHPQNLLLIHIERHEAWHRLFHTMCLDEVIDLLVRMQRMKKAQRLKAA